MEKLGCILIIDDDDTSSLLAQMMLNRVGAAEKIFAKTNGKEAIDYLEKCDERFPDLILLDINMPIMNGFDFLRIWERKGLASSSKIAMFTSSIREEDKSKSDEYRDVIGYIEKPLNGNKIEELINTLVSNEDYLSFKMKSRWP